MAVPTESSEKRTRQELQILNIGVDVKSVYRVIITEIDSPCLSGTRDTATRRLECQPGCVRNGVHGAPNLPGIVQHVVGQPKGVYG